jgi:uncharacterized protein YcnI
MTTLLRAVAAVLATLLLPAAVAAHVVVLPAASDAGGWERYSVLVPTEKESPTVRVEVKLPAGMEVIAVEAVPGWEGAYHPFPLGAARVEWKGGKIAPRTFVTFEFLAWNPPAAKTIAWQATQTYEDGSTDVWGADDPDHASRTTLRAAKDGHDHRRHGAGK